jgi:hypothetical protein
MPFTTCPELGYLASLPCEQRKKRRNVEVSEKILLDGVVISASQRCHRAECEAACCVFSHHETMPIFLVEHEGLHYGGTVALRWHGLFQFAQHFMLKFNNVCEDQSGQKSSGLHV